MEISMDIHGIHRYPLISMDIHRYPWISMSMDIHGYNGYPWISWDIGHPNLLFVKFGMPLLIPASRNSQLAGYD